MNREGVWIKNRRKEEERKEIKRINREAERIWR